MINNAKRIVHFEGMVVFLATIYMYSIYEFGLYFCIPFEAPDLSMLAYGINNHVGAKIYNVCHTYIISILIVLIGVYFEDGYRYNDWLNMDAHIGMVECLDMD